MLKKWLFWVRDALVPHRQTKKEFARDMGITLALMCGAALLCVVLNAVGDSDSTVPLVFVLAVLLTARCTDGYFYGLFATIVSVFGVNYAFTYPYFELNFVHVGYPLTFFCMLTVSLITSAMTTNIYQQNKIAREQEALLMEAEKEAVRRGCHHVHVDTMSWQAPKFYEKHGYETIGILPDIPKGNQKYLLMKSL